jgi:hypothetical protein
MVARSTRRSTNPTELNGLVAGKQASGRNPAPALSEERGADEGPTCVRDHPIALGRPTLWPAAMSSVSFVGKSKAKLVRGQDVLPQRSVRETKPMLDNMEKRCEEVSAWGRQFKEQSLGLWLVGIWCPWGKGDSQGTRREPMQHPAPAPAVQLPVAAGGPSGGGGRAPPCPLLDAQHLPCPFAPPSLPHLRLPPPPA